MTETTADDLVISPSAREAIAHKKLETLTVGDLMRAPVKVARVNDDLRHVHAMMSMGGYRHVPIVDATGKLCGVVSDRDVHLAWKQGQDVEVATFMRRGIEYVHPSAAAHEAAARMIAGKIGCLPVLDDDKSVVGIITSTDFLLVAHRALTIQRFLAES
ncbi:MAG: CBS domain-containing protein [Myxococcota bacterium]